MATHDRSTHIARLIVLSGAIGFAAACSTGPPEPVGTVTYWTTYDPAGPEFKTLTDELIPAFEAGHLWLNVEAKAIPADQLHDQVISAFADGGEPDVVAVDITQVAELADKGALLPLDTEMPDFPALAGSVHKLSLATNTWEGHTYGLPLEANAQLLVVNQQILDESGFGRIPASIAEFEVGMAVFQRVRGGFAFAADGTDAQTVLPWIWAFGGSITDESGAVASGYLNSPGTVTAVGRLTEWFQMGYLSPSMLGQGPPAIDQLGSGQAASMLGDASLPPILAARFPGLRIAVAPLPSDHRGGSSLLGGTNIVVSKDSNAKDAALAFVRYMLSEPAQLAFGKSGRMPAITSLVGRPELPAYLAPFASQLDDARAPVSSPNWAQIDQTIAEAVGSVVRGEAAVTPALNQAAETVDQLLAQ